MNLNEIRVQFKSGADLFDITLPTMFLSERNVPSLYYHEHLKYEIIFLHMRDGELDTITIIPPRCGHFAIISSEKILSQAFQFSIKRVEEDAEEGSIAVAFKALQKPIQLEDTIRSYERLQEIENELLNPQFATVDKLNALFLLLMADVARLLPYVRDVQPKALFRKVEDNTLELIEEYFMRNFHRPECRAEELAENLFISTRQLQRILQENFNMKFREMLLKVRMEKARGFQRVHPLKAAELARLTGYTSVPAFYAAYKKYFGAPFETLVE